MYSKVSPARSPDPTFGRPILTNVPPLESHGVRLVDSLKKFCKITDPDQLAVSEMNMNRIYSRCLF